jgi:hypothetical protein
MIREKWIPIFALSGLWVVGCLNDSNQMAGNGSEVENGLSGVVFSSDAARVSGAVVTLYPEDFNPLTDSEKKLERDITDEKGRYSFSSFPSKPYHVVARTAAGDLSALARHTHADTLILSKSGSVTLDARGIAGDVFIPGTGIRTFTGSSVLPSVPAGIFTILSRSSETLVSGIPVSSNHATRIPTQILVPSRDTYLESSEPDQNSGARQYLRLKSGGQGMVLLHFTLDSVSSLDSATLWLAVSEFQRDFIDYSYDASLYGFTAPWVEGTGYRKEDNDNGSTYLESQPGIPWPKGSAVGSLDSATRIDISFRGVRGVQIKHPFPVSSAILQGIQNGAYTGIAIVENSQRFLNVDFSSAEGYMPPALYLFNKE